MSNTKALSATNERGSTLSHSQEKGYVGMSELNGNAFGGILSVPKNSDGMRS